MISIRWKNYSLRTFPHRKLIKSINFRCVCTFTCQFILQIIHSNVWFWIKEVEEKVGAEEEEEEEEEQQQQQQAEEEQEEQERGKKEQKKKPSGVQKWLVRNFFLKHRNVILISDQYQLWEVESYW